MSRCLRRRSRDSSWRGVSSAAARMALVFLVWMGPVPVVHDHGNLSGSMFTSRTFALHLIRFHAEVDRQCSGSRGWHVHWVLPGGEDSGLAGGSTSRSAACVTAGQQPTDEASVFQGPFPGHMGLVLHESRSVELAGRFASSEAALTLPHFFSCFACRLSLPARLGILRC